MNHLRHTLECMQQLLAELHSVLQQEQAQLQRAQVNPVALQALSDRKSRLLSALHFFDEQRRQQEKALNIAAPYSAFNDLKPRWEDITAAARLTKEMNIALYPLLELQMKKATALNQLAARAGAGTALYRADGTSRNSLKGQAYKITV